MEDSADVFSDRQSPFARSARRRVLIDGDAFHHADDDLDVLEVRSLLVGMLDVGGRDDDKGANTELGEGLVDDAAEVLNRLGDNLDVREVRIGAQLGGARSLELDEDAAAHEFTPPWLARKSSIALAAVSPICRMVGITSGRVACVAERNNQYITCGVDMPGW